MQEIILKALKNIDIKSYFVTRPNYITECIVYNYISTPAYYSDNSLKGTNYVILLNLYCCSKVEKNKNLILEVMRKEKFKGGSVKATERIEESDGSVYFNTPITFKYFLRKDD